MSRIRARCKELNARGEGMLIGYLMVGDPDLAKSREYVRAMIAGGIDFLGLGIPFSDPVADGLALQAAGARALKAGVTPPAVFELVKELRREISIPIVLMTYYNPVLSIGEEAFLKRSLEAGADGVIVSDLPVEEATSFIALARRHGMDTIFLITPQTSEERLMIIARETTGFLYVLSRYGGTGAPTNVPANLETLIRRIRALVPVELPMAVEFGISDPGQVGALIRAGAQGVIVGHALTERIAAEASPEQLREFVQTLKAGTRTNLTLPVNVLPGETIINPPPVTGDGAPRLSS